VRSKIFRCYGDLKFLENDLRHHYDPGSPPGVRGPSRSRREGASTLNIPLAFSDLLYTLREHINLVRDELRRLATNHDKDNERMKSFLIANPKGGSGNRRWPSIWPAISRAAAIA
jgi:hypothetical protein